MISGVEQASANDFEGLMDMLLTAYRVRNPEHLEFPELLPDCYQPTDDCMANLFILRDDGKIVSNVGSYPISVNICGEVSTIVGIGGVATLPEYRGKNLMQTILDYVLENEIESGYPMSWLAGDRRRYQPWGYEHYNMEYNFMLSSRAPGLKKYLGKLPGEIKQGRVDELSWSEIWKQAQNNPYLIVCGEDMLRRKYQRANLLVAMIEGEKGSHIVIRKGNESSGVLVDFAGDPETIGAIVAEKLNNGLSQLAATLPLYPFRFCSVFKDLMSNYSLVGSGSIAILDLKKTLGLFRKHFNQRVSHLGLKGRVKLVMGPARQIGRQEVILEADGKELAILPGTSQNGCPVAEVTCHQAVELLFSPLSIGYSYKLAPEAQWLAALMPAPFFLPPLYHL